MTCHWWNETVYIDGMKFTFYKKKEDLYKINKKIISGVKILTLIKQNNTTQTDLLFFMCFLFSKKVYETVSLY